MTFVSIVFLFILYIIIACASSGYFSRNHTDCTSLDDKTGAVVSGIFWIITVPVYIVYKAGDWCYTATQKLTKGK